MRRTSRRTIQWMAGAVAFFVIGMAVHTTYGFRKWRSSPEGGWCSSCHGDFNGPTSPSGSTFPFDSKHLMHRATAEMNTDCSLCHYEGDENNPDLDRSASDGFGGKEGVGCLGCHGRDYGGDLGVMGVGLREHHRNIGVSSCGGTSCHAGDPDPLPENVRPPVYGSFQTKAWDQCNRAPLFGESFTLNNDTGLDNDGDLLRDEDDPDCIAVTCNEDIDGDGLVGFDDLLIILSEWGPCEGDCPADIDGNNDVGFSDLLLVLSAWGPCPE